MNFKHTCSATLNVPGQNLDSFLLQGGSPKMKRILNPRRYGGYIMECLQVDASNPTWPFKPKVTLSMSPSHGFSGSPVPPAGYE